MGKSMKLFHIYRMAKSSLEKHLYGFSSLENFGEQNSEFEKSLSLNAAPQYKQIQAQLLTWKGWCNFANAF